MQQEHERKASARQLWFRLKGAALSYYNDDSYSYVEGEQQQQQPVGIIGLTDIKEVRQIPGTSNDGFCIKHDIFCIENDELHTRFVKYVFD